MMRSLRTATAALVVLVLALPIATLCASASPLELLSHLRTPLVRDALRLSIVTSGISIALVIALGTPLAWMLARRPSAAIETMLELPVVLPPAVVGVALLMTFGRRGVLGGALESLGITIAFTPPAAILAQFFVSAPHYVLSAIAALRSVDTDLVAVARTLGAAPGFAFLRVELPLAWPGLLSGATLAFARALGEFGATLLFAGNLEGRTQTLPLAIYTALESDLDAARALAVLLVLVSLALLALLRAHTRRRG